MWSLWAAQVRFHIDAQRRNPAFLVGPALTGKAAVLSIHSIGWTGLFPAKAGPTISPETVGPCHSPKPINLIAQLSRQ